MAKLLLGKEVNASINEEIKAKVEKLKAKVLHRRLESSVSAKEKTISHMKKVQQNDVRRLA